MKNREGFIKKTSYLICGTTPEFARLLRENTRRASDNIAGAPVEI
jgi:hypothetical protein